VALICNDKYKLYALRPRWVKNASYKRRAHHDAKNRPTVARSLNTKFFPRLRRNPSIQGVCSDTSKGDQKDKRNGYDKNAKSTQQQSVSTLFRQPNFALLKYIRKLYFPTRPKAISYRDAAIKTSLRTTGLQRVAYTVT
jgi:hypothetical protein